MSLRTFSPWIFRLLFTSPLIFCSAFVSAALEKAIDETAFAPLVTIVVSPLESTHAYVVVETISGAALPTEISHDGSYDEASQKLKWGPFTDGEGRTLTYRLVGDGGNVEVSTQSSSNGVMESIDPVTVDLKDPGSHYYGILYQATDPRVFFESNQEEGNPLLRIDDYAFPSNEGLANVTLQRMTGEDPTVSFSGLVNGEAADLIFDLQVSSDLDLWEDAGEVIPSLGSASQQVSGLDGVNLLSYEDLPLVRPFFRFRASLAE